MGFMGLGKADDKILDLDAQEVKKEIQRLEISDQKTSADLDKTNSAIDLNMQKGSEPGLKDHEREKYALRISSLKSTQTRHRSQLAEIRKKLRSTEVLFDVLEKSRFYESDLEKKINDLDPEDLERRLESLALAKKDQMDKYDNILTTGNIFVDANAFELDSETQDILAQLKQNAGEN